MRGVPLRPRVIHRRACACSISHRSSRYGTVQYFDVINGRAALSASRSKRKAVAAIDDICAVDGVDCVFIGPSDLAAGYGYLGNPLHPEVQEAMQGIIASAKAHGNRRNPGAGRSRRAPLPGNGRYLCRRRKRPRRFFAIPPAAAGQVPLNFTQSIR